MADSTTVFIAAGSSAYSVANGGTPVAPVVPTPITALPGSPTGIVLPSQFTLYLSRSITAQATLNVATLIQALDNSTGGSTNDVPAFYGSDNAFSEVAGPAYTVTVFRGGTLLVPVTSQLDSTVHLNTLLPALDQAYASPSAPQSNPTLTSVPATSDGGSVRGGTSQTSTTAATAKATSAHGDQSDHGVSNTTFSGALAGGIIGGLVVGAAICLMVVLCCFKQRRSPRSSSTSEKSEETGGTTSTAERKVPHASETAMPITGWQKHLPQEKDNRTIRDTLQNLFDHIEMHIDGYYDSSPVGLSSGAIHALEGISGDGTGDMIPTSRNVSPLLQSILARFIIHRISLRARAEQSFLPDEYTTMPEMYGWHMENDGREKSVSSNSQRGFPQAFSQWQMLTAFIRSDTQGDAEFRRALNAKINKAVHSVSEAFAPWERPDNNRPNQSKSLQSILEEASRAGIMIFRQRSLYTFDWSSGGRMDGRYVVVTPAVVKEIDEYGEPLWPSQVLIEATRQSC